MRGLLALGHKAIWDRPYHARKVALERCIEHQNDPTRKAALEHALARVATAEKLYTALMENENQ